MKRERANNEAGSSTKNRNRLSETRRCGQTSPNFFLLARASLRAREVSTGVYPARIYRRHRGLLTRNGIKPTCRYPICRKIIFCSSAFPITRNFFLNGVLISDLNPRVTRQSHSLQNKNKLRR